jgi:drug/metabolite transporter (DMT)-like permease
MSDKLKGILYMLLASLAFSTMSAFVKITGSEIPAYEKVFFRSFISVMVLAVLVKRNKLKFFGKRKHQKALLFRSLLGTTAMIMFFYGIPHVHLADGAMIGKLNPFFVTLFAFLFLKEKLSKIQIPALILAFGAAALIIKPKWDIEMLPYLALLGGAAFSAGGHTMLRALKGKEAPATIIFYFSLITTIILLPITILNFKMPQGIEWIYLLGIGIMAVIGQLGLTYAYRCWLAAEISIYSYSGILFAGILGFFIFDEVPDWMSILGGLIIVGVSLLVYLYKRRKRPVRSKQAPEKSYE